MTTAKHAYRGTMAALKELGLNKDTYIETVDAVAQEIIKQEKSESENLTSNSFRILLVSPDDVCNWSLHDRPESELGDLDALAKDIKSNSQISPCIVRKNEKGNTYKYELIAGERRWRAVKLANIKLKVIVTELDDYNAALCQASENANRKGLSDFAKGMSYSRLIKKEVLKQTDLTTKLGLTSLQINRLMSFSSVPAVIWDAIEDPSRISSRTASEMRALSKKGEDYVKAMIALAPKLKSGKLGHNKLKQEVSKMVNESPSPKKTAIEVKSKNGRHLFTLRNDSNGNISVTFPKDIRRTISHDFLKESFSKIIEDYLMEV